MLYFIKEKEQLDDSNYEENEQEKDKTLEANANDFEERATSVRKRIMNISASKKMGVWFILGLIAIVFSSYFIAVYQISRNAYGTISDGIENLNVFYKRSHCLTQIFITYREEVIRNAEPSHSFTLSNIESCMDIEYKYMNIKKNLGPHLQDIEGLIN